MSIILPKAGILLTDAIVGSTVFYPACVRDSVKKESSWSEAVQVYMVELALEHQEISEEANERCKMHGKIEF